MNLRILSGILIPKLANGVATISFNPFSITGDAEVSEAKTLGGPTNYKGFPTKILSLRKFTISDKNTFFGGSENDLFNIDDHFANNNTLVLKWASTGGSLINEIAFMIIGEVE
jgi:hypothetical protein